MKQNEITIATRGSQLALWQANFVKEQLESLNRSIKLLKVSTKGDRVQDRFLHEIGGKGLFIRELESKLISKEADIAVHSLKDLPAKLPKEFCLLSILKRHDIQDVLILNPKKHKKENFCEIDKINPKNISKLENFTIATSSLRRSSLLKSVRKNIKTVPIRGNVDTRIEKLKSSELDGIILAGASLERLGITHVEAIPFDSNWFVPSAGQGALAIESLANPQDLKEVLSLDCVTTHFCVDVEREVLFLLGGDCTMPMGVNVTLRDQKIFGEAIVLDYEGSICRYSYENPHLPDRKVSEIAQDIYEGLKGNGLMGILASLKNTVPSSGNIL